jgi:putative ABC transport system permease protein
MLSILWLKGLLLHRSGRLLGTMVGVALTVALLASIGAFIASSAASMTQRAIADVPVDWQVQLSPGTDVATAITAIGQATSYTSLEQVGYANVSGFVATTGVTTQTTGAGKVVGISASYRQHFPKELRLLLGSYDGVLVAQQTASNLHVTIGDTVTIQRLGVPATQVKVAGIVDMPNADSFFQAVGIPTSAAPQAPPDNVVLLPMNTWHQLFDTQANVRPDSVRTQLHVRIAHALPNNPNDAYLTVLQQANNVEARIAGSGIVGNNLAARLDGVRKDALYAQVLFLFLGLPGVVLAILLTLAVAASGATRHCQEQALLRVRGSSLAQILRLEFTEAGIIGCGGVLLGIVCTYLAATFIISSGLFVSTTALIWLVGAALVGFLLALVALLYPAWQQTRQVTTMAARAIVGRTTAPLWQRIYLDIVLLAVAALMYWRTASTGYQVVLAPEGVASSSVAYETFLAPACLWIGVSLLTLRLWNVLLKQGRTIFAGSLRPIAHGLSGVVAASLGRQRVVVTRGLVLVALAFSFAISTAVFNTTYNAQAQVDAQLTNGADVAVTGPTTSPPSSKLADLKALPSVVAAQPMQHRFAYVGTDLQDIFGINAIHIGDAAPLSNAFFGNGNAQATLATLAAHPDGILVSEETVMNFQLQVGDLLNLRILNAQDHSYHVVPFHFLGVVREFPTAPKDSFLIVNSSYLVQQSGAGAAEVVLLRVNGDVGSVAKRAQDVVSGLAGARVTDIGSTQRTISSSLTAVDLRGLTALELAFAILFVAGATGLVLALGLAERRRTFAILSALGAKQKQLGAFLWSEGLLLQIGGGVIGIVLGVGVAQMLVSVLTGVFDPAPEILSIPWFYLVALVLTSVISTVLAVVGTQVAIARHPVVEALRGL